jgi:hypothetical protein
MHKNVIKISLQVERVVDGGETAMFKQYFSSWKECEDSPYAGLGRTYPAETIAAWDVGSLHADNRGAIHHFLRMILNSDSKCDS